MSYSDFVARGYSPSESELICLFRIEPAKGITMDEAAGRVASESSNGTWTEVVTMSERIRRLSAKAFEFDGKYVKVAYPPELFEPGNMPQIWSSIAGNIFGMKAVRRLRLEDVYWPESIVRSFKGPGFGLAGVREVMKVRGRPLTATVPKPKVGMTAREHADVAYELWIGGIDLVKDDENLASQNFNKFEERVKMVLRARDKAEKETGERKSALLNVTAESKEMVKRAELVKDYGGEFVMVDILTAGWSALQTLRNAAEELGLAIHAHRAFHAAFTRDRRHGVSMKVVASSARLVGVDLLHVGTVVGKLEAKKVEVLTLADILREDSMEESRKRRVLKKRWLGTKPVVPVSSGGLHPGLIPDIISMFGVECLIQAGGGVLGHPNGPRAGAAALRQAIDASLEGISLDEYAEKHEELKTALEHWGYLRPV